MNKDYSIDLSIQLEQALIFLSQSNSSKKELANQELYRRFTPLIHKLANKLACNSYIKEDLIQVGSLAMMEALAKYDLKRGTPLVSYLYPHLKGSMINFLNKERRYSSSLYSIDEYPILISLSATVSEVLSHKNRKMLIEDCMADEKETNCPSRSASLKNLIKLIENACSFLSDQQYRVFNFYIVDEFRPSEIANIIGISRPRVTILLKKALNKVRLQLAPML